MLKLRKPEILPINDHIWLLDDNHEATCYVVAGRERALVIDTSIGLCNIRETAEALTSIPLICVNTHGHGDHIGGNWAFEKAYMNLADLPLAKECLNIPELQEGLAQLHVSYPPFEHIEDGRVIDLGGVELEVLVSARTYAGRNRAAGSTGQGSVFRRRHSGASVAAAAGIAFRCSPD